MTRKERLRDDYEDALFTILMNDFTQQEDQKLKDEAVQLEQDPATTVPSALDERCHRLIRRSFSKQRWKKRTYTAYRTFQYTASIVLVLGLLFGTAYAIFPEVQAKTLALLIEAGDVSTKLTLESITGGTAHVNEAAMDANGQKILMGYRLPEIPAGFEIDFEDRTDVSAFIAYVDADGRTIQVSIDPAEGAAEYVDTEDAQNIEEIQIHGFDGLLIEKNDRVHIIWADTEQFQYITVCCTGVEKDFVIEYANAITFDTIS